MEYWAYTIVGIIVAELFYLLVRWYYGTPEFRGRVWEAIWGYMLSWITIASIIALLNEAGSITSTIASSFNIPVIKPSPGYIEGLLVNEVSGWVIFWGLIAILKSIGSVSAFGFQLGVFSAVADYFTRITSLQWFSFELYIADLAILYVLSLFWDYFTKYGLWVITASLILPRATRGIGATFTSYYLVLTIALPVMFGIAYIEQPYTLAVIPPWYIHCNSSNLALEVTCIIGQLLAGNEVMSVINLLGYSPVNAFHALVWDILLALAYALAFTVAYYIARLIDYGAFRLLDVVV